jgi:hypothetical protein
VARSSSIAVILAFLIVLVCCSPQQRQEQPLTAEGKAYARSLSLQDVTMKAADSYARQTLTEIEGSVKNTGGRSVDKVDVFCNFYDVRGILVLKERVVLVKRTLKPGETRKFRLAFDDIPQSWNSQMPALVIAQVIFS